MEQGAGVERGWATGERMNLCFHTKGARCKGEGCATLMRSSPFTQPQVTHSNPAVAGSRTMSAAPKEAIQSAPSWDTILQLCTLQHAAAQQASLFHGNDRGNQLHCILILARWNTIHLENI